MDRVDAPRLRLPRSLGQQQALGVAAPCRPGPSHALAEESYGVSAQRGLDAGGGEGLDPDFPAVVDGPARDEVVVVGVEGVDQVTEEEGKEEGALVEETVAERCLL